MDLDDYRQFRLLTEIASGDAVTQRRLAQKHGLALGLINFLIRRLVKKGYVKSVNLERKRLRYLITPKGLAEKARLTYQYLEYSLALYRHMRTLLTRTLAALLEAGGTHTVLYGTGELAEITFLAMQQHGFAVVAVVDDSRGRKTVFMNQPVKSVGELSTLVFDQVVIATFRDHQKIIQSLCRIGVAPHKIVTISPRGRLATLPEAPVEPFLEAPELPAEVSRG